MASTDYRKWDKFDEEEALNSTDNERSDHESKLTKVYKDLKLESKNESNQDKESRKKLKNAAAALKSKIAVEALKAKLKLQKKQNATMVHSPNFESSAVTSDESKTGDPSHLTNNSSTDILNIFSNLVGNLIQVIESMQDQSQESIPSSSLPIASLLKSRYNAGIQAFEIIKQIDKLRIKLHPLVDSTVTTSNEEAASIQSPLSGLEIALKSLMSQLTESLGWIAVNQNEFALAIELSRYRLKEIQTNASDKSNENTGVNISRKEGSLWLLRSLAFCGIGQVYLSHICAKRAKRLLHTHPTLDAIISYLADKEIDVAITQRKLSIQQRVRNEIRRVLLQLIPQLTKTYNDPLDAVVKDKDYQSILRLLSLSSFLALTDDADTSQNTQASKKLLDTISVTVTDYESLLSYHYSNDPSDKATTELGLNQSQNYLSLKQQYHNEQPKRDATSIYMDNDTDDDRGSNSFDSENKDQSLSSISFVSEKGPVGNEEDCNVLQLSSLLIDLLNHQTNSSKGIVDKFNSVSDTSVARLVLQIEAMNATIRQLYYEAQILFMEELYNSACIKYIACVFIASTISHVVSTLLGNNTEESSGSDRSSNKDFSVIISQCSSTIHYAVSLSASALVNASLCEIKVKSCSSDDSGSKSHNDLNKINDCKSTTLSSFLESISLSSLCFNLQHSLEQLCDQAIMLLSLSPQLSSPSATTTDIAFNPVTHDSKQNNKHDHILSHSIDELIIRLKKMIVLESQQKYTDALIEVDIIRHLITVIQKEAESISKTDNEMSPMDISSFIIDYNKFNQSDYSSSNGSNGVGSVQFTQQFLVPPGLPMHALSSVNIYNNQGSSHSVANKELGINSDDHGGIVSNNSDNTRQTENATLSLIVNFITACEKKLRIDESRLRHRVLRFG